MMIELVREIFTDHSTIGRLNVDGGFCCWTLEDTDRHLEDGGKKIYGKTAIPTGVYQILITYSPKFKRDLPLLLNVPGFSGIRIHAGNKPEDTEGCILTGLTHGIDCVNHSRAAFMPLFDLIQSSISDGKSVFIDIKRRL